jgi:curli biogenesis system outer membrane secretion channel CsgG
MQVSINRNFDFSKIKRIAVMQFDDYPGATDSGKQVADLFIGGLLNIGVSVIERMQMNQLLAEQKLSLSGYIDPNQVKEVGKMLSADALLLGTVSQYTQASQSTQEVTTVETNRRGDLYDVSQPYTYLTPAQVSISCKLVSVETGEVIFAASGSYDGSTPAIAAQSLVESMADDIAQQINKKK